MSTPYVQFGVAVAMKRDYEAIQILSRGQLDPNGAFGRTPLGIAAEHGSVPVMRELIALGARLDRADPNGGETPLWWATVKNHPSAIGFLIENGASVDLSPSGTETPLFRAAKLGLAPAVGALIAGSADVNRRGPKGQTPLIAAVRKEAAFYNPSAAYDEVIALLISHGADRSARSDDGFTASSLAELRGDPQLASRLSPAAGSKGGCYVATAVYGTYDCPEVWVLRRFRDRFLARTSVGRFTTVAYYAVSPGLVRIVGGRRWFTAAVRPLLDSVVARLEQNGFEGSPYEDRPSH